MTPVSRRRFCKLLAAVAGVVIMPQTNFVAARSDELQGGAAGVDINGTYEVPLVFHKGQNVGPSEVIHPETMRYWQMETEKINSQTWVPKCPPHWRVRSIEARPVKGDRAMFTVSYRFESRP